MFGCETFCLRTGPASGRLPMYARSLLDTSDLVHETLLKALQAFGQIEAREPGSNLEPVGPEAGLTAMPRYLNNRAASIYGGSNEIQRDIIARLVLGL